MYKEIVPEVKRWRMAGTFRTKSPLHVGDGDRRPLSERVCFNPEGMDGDPKYATVFRNYEGKPIVPGTSWKGSLRAWAKAAGLPDPACKEIFGTEEQGGRVTFHDAVLVSAPEPKEPKYQFWSGTESTALAPHVVLDPRTRSAEQGLLYYVEYVPAGAQFHVMVTAQNLSEQGRELLLIVLENAWRDGVRPARLGSETGNGWGEVAWQGGKEQFVDANAIRDWLAAPEKKSWTEVFRKVPGSVPAAKGALSGQPPATAVKLKMELRFQGPMLVNDPTRQRKKSEGVTPVSHVAIQKLEGGYVLPAKSVRGVLRGQARRIWQTLAWHRNQDLNRSVDAVASLAKVRTELGAFYRAFGATGWKSPLVIPDFACGSSSPHPQEFVAIDRFTGGAAEERKFRAEALHAPSFHGEIVIRTDRWLLNEDSWPWLLLAYTLRDWMEGDARLGAWQAKGYGEFRATVTVEGNGLEAALLRDIVAGKRPDVPLLKEWDEALQAALDEREGEN